MLGTFTFTNSQNSFIHKHKSMLGTLLLPSRGLKLNKSAIVKSWNDYLKTYKKTGIRLRQAIITAPNGEIMSQDGENALTKADLMRIRKILQNGDECSDVLHLENLYYCVKVITDDLLVVFNGANYVIACLTDSQHILIVNIKARKLDGARTMVWIKNVAEKLRGVAPL